MYLILSVFGLVVLQLDAGSVIIQVRAEAFSDLLCAPKVRRSSGRVSGMQENGQEAK